MQKQWIVSNPKVMMGKPVIAGTRITVELILEKLAAGETIEQILEAHPHLTREAVLAAMAFARDALRAAADADRWVATCACRKGEGMRIGILGTRMVGASHRREADSMWP
jgi:uncharacterized protein (DUF433 family)